MPSCIVLGAGMVGSVIASDMCRDFETSIADIRPQQLAAAEARAARINLGKSIRGIAADLSDPAAITKLVAPFDLVIGALSSKIGLAALGAVIAAGKNYCDISFMAQDSRELDAQARAKGITCITDCGVAPGMSNILAARGAMMLENCTHLEIYVGGLPRDRRWPFQYKAGFSPADVIEEYTRPARLVEHGKIVIREALSEPELLEFDGVGTLEAFNTDGLRSLANGLTVPFMKEKTLRYPGHIELMRVFRHLGLFSEEAVDVKGASVRPLDLTSSLLFPKWTYQPGEEDLTVMRVEARGTRGGSPASVRWDLFDLFDRETSTTSMARTTAFPCAIVARMIHSGKFSRPGVFAPEVLSDDPETLSHIMREHEARGVRYAFTSMGV